MTPTIRILAAAIFTIGLAVASAASADHLRTAQAEAGDAAAPAGDAAAPAEAQDGGVGAPATSNATAALWEKHCASCHGEDGKADTKSGKMLKVKDLTDPEVRAAFDRDRMVKATKEGVKKEGSDKLVMKGFADKLTDAEIAALIEHIHAMK